MKIRAARIEDAKCIVETHYDAIHNIASADYNKTILNTWHSGVTKSKIEKTKKIISNTEEEIFVCDDNGKVVGFSSIVPNYNELRAVYVRADYNNKGIGTQLLQILEKRASELNLHRLQLHSSITAKRFYQKYGYGILRNGTHTLSNGKKMDCILMEKNFNSKPTTELVIDNSLQSCINFLEKRKETCLFLLGNLSEHGFNLNTHPNSGNYRLLKRNNEIVGVFSMTRRGNLLIQTDNMDNYSHEIYEVISIDKIQIKGIIGPWKDCILFKIYYETVDDNFKANLISKEWLYSLPLNTLENKNIVLKNNLSVQFLTQKNFEQWDELNHEYLKETDLLDEEITSEERKRSFKEQVKRKNWWGVFLDKELVSIGAYNIKYKNIGQIGGVFTPPEKRRKGYSKLCMKQLIIDSRAVHQLNTLILFTNENNIAAQSLYKSLGFKQIGYFGLIFG